MQSTPEPHQLNAQRKVLDGKKVARLSRPAPNRTIIQMNYATRRSTPPAAFQLWYAVQSSYAVQQNQARQFRYNIPVASERGIPLINLHVFHNAQLLPTEKIRRSPGQA